MTTAFFNLHTHYSAKKTEKNAIVSFDVPEERTAETYEGSFSFGLHPWSLSTINITAAISSVSRTAALKNCLALGECGLDRARGPSLDAQKDAFISQINIAESLAKPMIIHCVRAFPELISIRKTLRPQMRWAVHRFNGSLQTAAQLLEHRIMLSFGAELLHSQKLRHTFAELPMDSLFLETDDSTVDIQDIYQTAAKLRNTTPLKLAEYILRNSQCLFCTPHPCHIPTRGSVKTTRSERNTSEMNHHHTAT